MTVAAPLPSRRHQQLDLGRCQVLAHPPISRLLRRFALGGVSTRRRRAMPELLRFQWLGLVAQASLRLACCLVREPSL